MFLCVCMYQNSNNIIWYNLFNDKHFENCEVFYMSEMPLTHECYQDRSSDEFQGIWMMYPAGTLPASGKTWALGEVDAPLETLW
jgi:hypothetical protein